ncbi:MAG TPA: esterase, partial [Prochlorococcus sp.]
MRFDKRLLLAAIFCGVTAGIISRPAVALERLVFNVPVLDVQIDFELGEAKSAGDLIEENPDFMEFDRATDGAFLLLL